MIKICVIDFESTGLPAENHPAAIIEAAFYNVFFDGQRERARVDKVGFQTFVKSTVPVDVEARAVHHITDDEIASGILLEHALLALSAEKPDFFCAHNADFEKQFFTGGGTSWLDTYKIALRLWPDAPAHSNQVLRYFLGFELVPELSMPPHRALPDCYVTAHILQAALHAGESVEVLRQWSAEPALLVTVGFGKHRGKLWADVDTGYLEWCLGQDMDAGVKHTARHHLRQRMQQKGKR